MDALDLPAHTSAAPTIRTGVRVAVRTRYDGGWSAGFEVADLVENGDRLVGYHLRRQSDGTTLPVVFSAEDIIPYQDRGT